MLSFSEYRQLDEAVDVLHKAFRASRRHTQHPSIPDSAVHDLNKPGFHGVHGWVHPDGTYYHIKQPKKLTHDTEIHHNHAAAVLMDHLPYDMTQEDSEIEAVMRHGVARVTSHNHGLTVTTIKPLTDAQQMTIARGLKTYNSIYHSHDGKRLVSGSADRAEHPGQMFVAKARAALNLGRKPS